MHVFFFFKPTYFKVIQHPNKWLTHMRQQDFMSQMVSLQDMFRQY